VISLLVPTRKRPKEFKRFYESAMAMADNPEEVEIVCYMDEDDKSSYDFGPRVTICTGPRVVLSEMWNVCWKAARGPYYGHMGDDIVFKSKGWDTRVKEAIDEFPGKIGFVWGDDMSPNGRSSVFGTHGFVHKNWTDVTERFVPPYFSSDYNDVWFNDLADMLEIGKYLPDVKTDHLHHIWGKAQIDSTTRDRLERHERDKVEELYYSAEMEWERHDEAFRLRQAIEKAEGKKVKLSILVCTLLERGPQFKQLVERTLAPQVKKFDGEVEIIAYWNNGERPLSEIRQALIEEARGDYICFVDDDDQVPGYYVEKIMEAIETEPDYVGWRMQAYWDNIRLKPTYHSLKYERWYDNQQGYYRHVSHLNPVKRKLALKQRYKKLRKGVPEDVTWSNSMVKHLKTEVYIEDVMYYYYHFSDQSRWMSGANVNIQGKRPSIRSAAFRYHPECAMAFKIDYNKVKTGYAGPGPAP
jgi:Glycosyl transferase family 2